MLKNREELSVVSSCILALFPVTTNRLLGSSLRWATGCDDNGNNQTNNLLCQFSGCRYWSMYVIIQLSVRLNGFFLSLINPFPNKPFYLDVCSTSLLKTLWKKEKLLIMSNFSFSHGVFYPFGELSAIFIKFKIVGCKLFQFGRV